jgi:hypothetical protein
LSSIDPIRPVSGPPPIQPFRRPKRDDERDEQPRDEPDEAPSDEAEPDEDARPSIDLRA